MYEHKGCINILQDPSAKLTADVFKSHTATSHTESRIILGSSNEIGAILLNREGAVRESNREITDHLIPLLAALVARQTGQLTRAMEGNPATHPSQ